MSKTNQRYLFVDEDGDLVGTDDTGIAEEHEAMGATVYDTHTGRPPIPKAVDIREPEEEDEDEDE